MNDGAQPRIYPIVGMSFVVSFVFVIYLCHGIVHGFKHTVLLQSCSNEELRKKMVSAPPQYGSRVEYWLEGLFVYRGQGSG